MVKLTKSNLQQKWKGKPGCRAVSAQNCICASSSNANGRVAWTFFGLEVVVFTQLQQDVHVLRSWYFEGWHAPCPWKQEWKMIISSNYKFDPFFHACVRGQGWNNGCEQFPTIIWRICTGFICRNFVFVKQVWNMPSQAPVPCASCASWCASYASCASWCAFWQRRDAQNLKTPTSRMRRAGNIMGEVVPAACSQTKKQTIKAK